MRNQDIAQRAFADARKLYVGDGRGDAAALKSANKARIRQDRVDELPEGESLEERALLDPELGIADQVFAGRLRDARDTLEAMRGSRERGLTPIEAGKTIVKMASPRAMNCRELAEVACYFAVKHSKDTGRVARVNFLGADHGFCLVGNWAYAQKLNGVQVSKLPDIDTSESDLWVVDPWANFWCPLRAYPAFAAARFEKWTRDGKRVAWRGGWASPAGEYTPAFLAATLRVVQAG